MCVRIGVIACGPNLFFAKFALAAGNSERHNHAISALKIGNVFANFLDDAHEFMAEYIALLHSGNETVKQMEIGPANCRARYLDDGIVWIQNSGIVDVV